ncbi:hypothetical protein [Dactylosporangium darangshiense]|uniref:hypothetical protein n=1 Tax=Dactylosporangium darangshiense TaxID=579108 RepID=UPI0036329F02
MTVTLPWNPPCQELRVWYVALHAPPPPPDERLGDGDALGERDADGEADGEPVRLADGEAVGDPAGGYGALAARL